MRQSIRSAAIKMQTSIPVLLAIVTFYCHRQQQQKPSHAAIYRLLLRLLFCIRFVDCLIASECRAVSQTQNIQKLYTPISDSLRGSHRSNTVKKKEDIFGLVPKQNTFSFQVFWTLSWNNLLLWLCVCVCIVYERGFELTPWKGLIVCRNPVEWRRCSDRWPPVSKGSSCADSAIPKVPPVFESTKKKTNQTIYCWETSSLFYFCFICY